MVRSRTSSQCEGSYAFEMERKYSVPSNPESRAFSGNASEDLHAWSIYRQNLNSDFTDCALGSTDKSPLPYGNFRLRDTTVQSILSHPRYGPKSALGSNMYTYLKFGLPRVFPPNHNSANRSVTPQHFTRNASARTHARGSNAGSRIPRDGSSGYDSSDNETNNQYKQNRKYRSDPDFRMQNTHPAYQQHHQNPGIPISAIQQSGIRPPPNQWNRNKSISEANLLATEYSKGHYNPQMKDPRRNSVAELCLHDIVDHSGMGNMNRPMSKQESHLSFNTRKSYPRTEFIPTDDESGNVFLYPHLQVVSVGVYSNFKSSCRGKQHLLLNDISFEVRGGEILAIMCTSEKEGTALLDILSGKHDPLVGHIILNAQRVKRRALQNRVAYVQNDPCLCEDMTAVQTLKFHYDLKKPTDKLGYFKIDAMDRINILIEDLGLEQVRHAKVSSMTVSERKRLIVACHLLLDTDIVLLDQPTAGMDIFDTFFLVEYLRHWSSGGTANSLGRIVILTLHPPTYEIFMMLSRILLVSAGRTMYSGKRKDMLAYFASVGYPCPPFKNPSDYYLDLVTLDDLAAEAMLESSQRIEQLAEIHKQKQEPLSDPGPPTSLPLAVMPAGFFVQGFVLFTKAVVYSQSNTFLNWLTLMVTSASLSLIIGAIFWDVPKTDFSLSLNDRPGYHYAVMCLMIWPLLLLLTCSEIHANRNVVERDIRHNLYGRFTYIFFKTLINIFPSLLIWLNYLVPSYSMSGLYMQSLSDYDGFYIYIGVMLLYLCCLQIFLTAFIYLVPFSNGAVIASSIVLTFLFSASGYVIHFNDMPIYIRYIKYVSPTEWLLPYLLNRELTPEALTSALSSPPTCRNKQIQNKDIIVQVSCQVPNGTHILSSYSYLDSQNQLVNYNNIPIALLVFYVTFLILTILAFIMNIGGSKRRINKKKS